MTDEYGIEAAGHKCKQIESGYEYNTLMRLLGVSVSKHLLDKHFTCIWANDYFYDLIGYSKAEFEELFFITGRMNIFTIIQVASGSL